MGKKNHSWKEPRYANGIRVTHKGLPEKRIYKIKAKEDRQTIRQYMFK
jgi:hypothetical protein